MQSVALSWLVYRMTKSAAALGSVECAQLSPMLVLGLVGGAVADRFDRKNVILITQAVAMCQAIVLAALTLTHNLQIWHAIVLAAVLGTCSAFEVPSRQAFIVEVVGKKELVNAISLNSSLFNGARALGPALASLVVVASNEGTCFAINAVTFLAAIFAIASIKIDRSAGSHGKREDKVYVMDAIKFVRSEPAVARVVRLAIVFSIFGLPYSVLMPIFAAEIMHGDVRTLGLLRGAAGLGAVTAALLLASRAKGGDLSRIVGFASATFAIGMLAFSLSTNLYLSLVLLFVTGFGMTTQLSSGHSLLQLAVPDRLRGRVMSIYMMVVLGFAPIGSFSVGHLAVYLGAPRTISICALVCIINSIVYLATFHAAGAKARKTEAEAQDKAQPESEAVQSSPVAD